MNELVATYVYDKSVSYGSYDIYACYDSIRDYDKRNVSFYDIYDHSGLCVNEGEPFYSMPSWKLIYDAYWIPSIREATKDHERDLKFLEQ